MSIDSTDAIRKKINNHELDNRVRLHIDQDSSRLFSTAGLAPDSMVHCFGERFSG